jgi:hypoxanthine phosphoribosyltransferase
MSATAQAWATLRSAELLCPGEQIGEAVARVAASVSTRLANEFPLVLTVMGGAMIFSGHLLPLLHFPLECDFLHLTRYGEATKGGHIRWEVFPRVSVRDRAVLVVDDILDEGHTAAAIHKHVLEAGARECLFAVLVDKQIGRRKPIAADFVGLELPDRFLFGFGMDVRGVWRNLPGIYAVKQD